MTNSTIVIYFDLCKAFDKVPHNRLLLKLESLGISNPLLSWFRSYLSNRKQSVKINNAYSPSITIYSSVLQSSVLGPLLF